MPQLCLYFQLHQPYRLREYSVFEVGNSSLYFEDKDNHNRQIFKKVSQKSYRPMLSLLLDLVKFSPDFKFSLSCSGVFLEQAAKYDPKIITLLKKLVKTGQVEILAETYYHSLAALYSPKEFRTQVYAHMSLVNELFGVKPQVFRNTELVYSNKIGNLVSKMRFKGMLTEAVPRYLHGRSKTQVFTDLSGQLPLLLKHAELSDDIAFRFSDHSWAEHPLTVEKYQRWVDIYGEDELVNLFMDFETFGEHQWEDTGIFTFFEEFIKKSLKKKWRKFVTPTEVFEALPDTKNSSELSKLPVYDVPVPISWADVDRDLTAWIDNPLQQDTIEILYGLSKKVLASKDEKLIADWRRLQTSDHFYYMCTKWSADGDVHAYFSPYSDPYEAYTRYTAVLADMEERVL